MEHILPTKSPHHRECSYYAYYVCSLLLLNDTYLVAWTLMVFGLFDLRAQSRSHMGEHLGRVLKPRDPFVKYMFQSILHIMSLVDGSCHCYDFWELDWMNIVMPAIWCLVSLPAYWVINEWEAVCIIVKVGDMNWTFFCLNPRSTP